MFLVNEQEVIKLAEHLSDMGLEGPADPPMSPDEEAYIKHMDQLAEEVKELPPHIESITEKQGQEGPGHDPYHVSEYTIKLRNGQWYTLHLGLGVWLDIDGNVEEPEFGSNYEESVKNLIKKFEDAAGWDLEHIQAYLASLPEDPMGDLSDYE